MRLELQVLRVQRPARPELAPQVPRMVQARVLPLAAALAGMNLSQRSSVSQHLHHRFDLAVSAQGFQMPRAEPLGPVR